MKTSTAFQVPATDKQVAYARALLADRAVDADFIVRFMQRVEDGTLTKDEASQTIKYALARPKAEVAAQASAAAPQPVPVEPGIYERDGRIFQVKQSKRTGNRYALVLTEKHTGVRRLTERGEVIAAEYVYAPGAVKNIKPEHRLTVARAEELSVVFGSCIRCGRTLKAAESVAAGIGPVCRKYI